jgi:hypothetical protein
MRRFLVVAQAGSPRGWLSCVRSSVPTRTYGSSWRPRRSGRCRTRASERRALFTALSLLLASVAGCAPRFTTDGAACPRLRSPVPGAVLDNGRTDRQDDVAWTFRWDPCPGEDAYQLYVIGSGATRPILDVVTSEASFTSTSPGSYVSDDDLADWTWMVRPRTGGRWGPWSESRAFHVEPPNTDPVATWTPAACPVLRSPAPGAVLDNGRRDRSDGIDWTFEWSACPGASEYWLLVVHRGSRFPMISEVLRETANRHVSTGGYVIDCNRTAWTWKVRARIGGEWQAWSEERVFEVEPVDTDGP